MKETLISLLALEPIHLDSTVEGEVTGAGEKLEKKQRHGRVIGTDLGGLGWDFAKLQVNANNFGISEAASVQFALSWTAPVFLDSIDVFTLVSAAPTFNMEVIGHSSVTIHLGFIELTLSLKMFPFKFTPFDILFRVDALQPKRYCSGMNYKVETFFAQLEVEWRVNECHFGLAGLLTNTDPSDCFWRSYKPQLPLYKLAYANKGNMGGSYWNYRCANWYSAGWKNWPITEDYLAQLKETSGSEGQSEEAIEKEIENEIDEAEGDENWAF